jgi:hypothetical protein
MIDFWKSIFEHVLGWPVAAFFLGLLFREPLTALVERIDHIKAPGVDLSAPQLAAIAQDEPKALPPPGALKGEIVPANAEAPTTANAVTVGFPTHLEERREALRKFGRGIKLVDEADALIRNELATLNMPLDSKDTADVLVRQLATTQMMLRSERTHRLIFGSQIVTLHLLKNAGPQPEKALAPIFENAREREPQFYGTYSFESWIGFLIKEGTVTKADNGLCTITVYGDSYLGYIGIFATGSKPH